MGAPVSCQKKLGHPTGPIQFVLDFTLEDGRREKRSFGAISDSEHSDHGGNMDFHRRLGDAQREGDLSIG
ncbi:hypothetical protein GCM10008965_43060 [Methylorubrum aminovorans]|nr:hypothetical protein GCM10025880_19750 [Methylorubrum aminovorans]